MIYVVGIDEQKWVKVGFSAHDDVGVRIAQLQTGCPYLIYPIIDTFGTIRQEKEIHKALEAMFLRAQIRIPPNEWYPGRNTMIKEFLVYMKYGPDAALAFLDSKATNVKQLGKKPRSLVKMDLKAWS